MDTRQLAAFCAVVERRSFSQAAERLGVTQPAVSLQVRALEKRLGTQLLDRSGRRVEPTAAGLRLYHGAQRLLALEEEIVDDLAREATGELAGTFAIGASTGPGRQGSVVSAVRAGFGVGFISRTAIEDDLADGRLGEARVVGLDAEREIWVVRAAGRTETRVAQTFIEFAKARLV